MFTKAFKEDKGGNDNTAGGVMLILPPGPVQMKGTGQAELQTRVNCITKYIEKEML